MGGLAPPLVIPFEIARFGRYGTFLSQIALAAGGVGLGVLALCAFTRVTRLASATIAFVAVLIAAITLGERVSRTQMCATAQDPGATSLRRNSLLWSLAKAPQEFPFDVHGLPRNGEDRFAWSYREMDWYPLRNTIHASVDATPIPCGPTRGAAVQFGAASAYPGRRDAAKIKPL